MTSKRQLVLLWSLWRKVATRAGYTAQEAEMYRDALTVAALEIDPKTTAIPSWKALKNPQVDALLARLNGLQKGGLDLEEAPSGVEPAADAAERRRLCYAVERDTVAAYGSPAAAETARASMLADFYPSRDPGPWQGLPLADLRKLATTAAHRRRSKFAELAGNPAN